MFVRGWLGQKGRAQQNAWQEEQEGTLGEAELFQILPREMWLVIFDFLSAKEACQQALLGLLLLIFYQQKKHAKQGLFVKHGGIPTAIVLV